MKRRTVRAILLACTTACGSTSGGGASTGAADAADDGLADGGIGVTGADGGGGGTDSGPGTSHEGGSDAGTKRDGSSDAATPAGGDAFPRLGSLLISTTSGATNIGYDAGYATWASKIHVNVFGANWVGAGASLLGGNREAFVKTIHSQSKIGARVIQYFDSDNTHEFWPMQNVDGWILYQHGTSGTCSPNFFYASDPTICNTNQTLYEPADSNGLHLEGEFAQALIATLIKGKSVDAAPSMDGTFHDNTMLTPTSAGDYARNGTEEPAGDATAGKWLREGLAENYTYLQAHSSLITIGNLGGWGISTQGGGTDASGLSGIVQGGIIEGVFGNNWSAETWSGFALAKTHYQFCMANTGGPRLVIVHHAKMQTNGADPSGFDSSGAPTGYGPAYQALRYGLAFTLMDDGYYATTQPSGYGNTARNWFDEFAVDPATGTALTFPNVDAGLGYLGQPTDPAWPAPMSNGVYARHFSNAAAGADWLVLLNPKGNGTQKVTLSAAMKKLKGSQDPTVNDGSSVTSVTLQDRDGLILKVH
jgi:hypothetical protein